MNYITLFLKKFVSQPVQPTITQDDVEFVINERLKEKSRLEKMLKTLRWQATSQLDEIKKLHGKILEQQNKKQSLIKKIELLNIDYLKILGSNEIEKENLLKLQEKIANLDSKKLKVDQISQQIKILQNEFEVLQQNVFKENEVLKRLKNEKLVLIKNKVKINSAPEKKSKKYLTKKKNSTRCTAKTKTKHRCKNHTKNESGFCHSHAQFAAPKRKMKIVNFNA
jgi:hypothetical protein